MLKQDCVAIMFYGWTKIDAFFEAWRGAGFQPVGHIVFRKSYSSKSRFLRYQHEQAFLLAKGRPPLAEATLGDVMEMPYSGNKLHPTQKPLTALAPLIRSSPCLMRRSLTHLWEAAALLSRIVGYALVRLSSKSDGRMAATTRAASS